MNSDELTRIGHDPDAFEAFYRAHVEAIQRFVVRRVDDPHLAADLTAEVFLAAVDAAHTYRPDRGAPAPWLYGIARNVVSAERRRAARESRATARVVGSRLLDDDDVARAFIVHSGAGHRARPHEAAELHRVARSQRVAQRPVTGNRTPPKVQDRDVDGDSRRLAGRCANDPRL